MSQWLLVQIAS
ncbi:BnaC04g02380D [Brassica napus]|uniref:BnaC04g02380D protein n=1 Tax=Brassica napus TaxID=3708 RepID=A0A078IR32_BRANA|nr:BnaC04g02380D [Brassica napus]